VALPFLGGLEQQSKYSSRALKGIQPHKNRFSATMAPAEGQSPHPRTTDTTGGVTQAANKSVFHRLSKMQYPKQQSHKPFKQAFSKKQT